MVIGFAVGSRFACCINFCNVVHSCDLEGIKWDSFLQARTRQELLREIYQLKQETRIVENTPASFNIPRNSRMSFPVNHVLEAWLHSQGIVLSFQPPTSVKPIFEKMEKKKGGE